MSSGRRDGSSRFRALVCASCLSILVFPVISVSDDLGLIPSEMEESNSCKPCFKASAGSAPRISGNSDSPPAEVVHIGFTRPARELKEQVFAYKYASAGQALMGISSSRAPPCLRSSPSFAPATTAHLCKRRSTLQILELSTVGSQHREPQANAAPNRPWSFKCELSLLTAHHYFQRTPRKIVRIACQLARDPVREFQPTQEA